MSFFKQFSHGSNMIITRFISLDRDKIIFEVTHNMLLYLKNSGRNYRKTKTAFHYCSLSLNWKTPYQTLQIGIMLNR